MRTLREKIANNNGVQTALLSAGLFVVFSLLCRLFPYTGDDWGWGSQIGLDRLTEWFAGYNGRYAGNLLVIALTRSKLLDAVVMGAFLTAVCLLPVCFTKGRDKAVLAFSTLLLLLVPREIFAQAVVWTSGFSNYVPPIVMTMLYFVAVKNIFEEDLPQYKRLLWVPVSLLGFFSALFMENVTLFNIGSSVLVIAIAFIRFRKVYAVHIAHFISCFAGAVLMFSNSAYGLIAKKQDFYRTTIFERGFTETVSENLKEIAERFFAENTVTVTVFTLLLVGLSFVFSRSGAEVKYRKISRAAMNINALCLVPFYCKGRLYDWDLFFESESYAVVTSAVLSLVVLLYFASATAVMLICIDCKKARSKALFLLSCIPMLVAPLIFVSPIGPRCFFPPYLMLTGVCVELFVYLTERLSFDARLVRKTGTALASVCAVILSFMFGVYGVIHWYDERRNDFAKKQAAEGFNTVVMYYLPYPYYVWNGDPDIEPWDDNYKQFHGIDGEVELKFILRENFDDFEKNFEQ